MAGQQAWHILFRVSKSTEQDYGNVDFGDRTMAVWLNNGNFLHFCTYTFAYNGGHNPNYCQNINFVLNEKQEWFFVYFGYSLKEKKAVGYLKTYNREASIVFANTYHMRYDNMLFMLAKDKFHLGWSGEVKQVKLNIGDGAFRAANISELSADDGPV